jgi:fructose-1-phosphate kinase PfkB-like protein
LAPGFQRSLFFGRLLPGGVNRAERSLLDASGKGLNAARVAVQAGGRAIFLSHGGGESLGLYKRLCRSDGVRAVLVPSPAGLRTCTTAIDLSTGQATELIEECPAVDEGTWPRLLDRFTDLLPSVDIVLYSGKPAPGYPENCAGELAHLCAARGTAFVIDARGPQLMSALPWSPLLCQLNEDEFTSTFGVTGNDQSRIMEKAAALSAEWGSAFLVTRGPERAILASEGQSISLPVRPVKALNPIGSGDACAAGTCLGLADGLGLEEAARVGLELGSRNAATARPGSIQE